MTKEQMFEDKEVKKAVRTCTRMIMKNLSELQRKDINPLAYAKVSLDTALYTMRAVSDSSESFKETADWLLRDTLDKICDRYDSDETEEHVGQN